MNRIHQRRIQDHTYIHCPTLSYLLLHHKLHNPLKMCTPHKDSSTWNMHCYFLNNTRQHKLSNKVRRQHLMHKSHIRLDSQDMYLFHHHIFRLYKCSYYWYLFIDLMHKYRTHCLSHHQDKFHKSCCTTNKLFPINTFHLACHTINKLYLISM